MNSVCNLKNSKAVCVGINVGTNGEGEGSNDAADDVVLAFLKGNPKASARVVAMNLGVSARQVERRIARLKQKGLLEREGSNKAGTWVVRDLG